MPSVFTYIILLIVRSVTVNSCLSETRPQGRAQTWQTWPRPPSLEQASEPQVPSAGAPKTPAHFLSKLCFSFLIRVWIINDRGAFCTRQAPGSRQHHCLRGNVVSWKITHAAFPAKGSLWGQREEEQSSRMKQKRSPRGPLCSLTKFLNKENFLAPKNQIASER